MLSHKSLWQEKLCQLCKIYKSNTFSERLELLIRGLISKSQGTKLGVTLYRLETHVSRASLFTSRHDDLFAPLLFSVKNGKNGKPYVLTLQDMEQDSLRFDLAAGTLEELFQWYQVAWDITQREMSKQYTREHEASIQWHVIR